MKWKDLKTHVDKAAREDKKIIKALKKVAPHLPDTILPGLYILVPDSRTLGLVFLWNGVVMYLLSSGRQTQKEVDFTVAHEFAHLVLEHPQRRIPPGRRVEKAANALARKWGFDSKHAY